MKYLERERARNKDPRRAAKVAAARAAMCQAKLDQMHDALQAFVSAGILQADVLTQHAPCETWGRVLIAITEAERAGTLPRGMVTVDQAELDRSAGVLHELINLWPGIRAVRTVTRRQ